jgi:hypothetical protein
MDKVWRGLFDDGRTIAEVQFVIGNVAIGIGGA